MKETILHRLPYNRALSERAKSLRKRMTPAEKKLWYEVLSNQKFENLRWLRQRPIDNYIADFYCAKYRLVIEIDGDSHIGREDYDEARTKTLEGYGITVLRFRNEEVLTNIAGVYDSLSEVVDRMLSSCARSTISE